MRQANHIHVLSPELANRLAPGEVVERPASVVKELIENSLDAGARRISVEIQDGGLAEVRVSDDGHGIARADVPLAVEHFATSKLRVPRDLEAVCPLGFRGEALASMAAVARLDILTRAEGELEGTRLNAGEGQVQVVPAASPVGASVTVRDLFYNAPSRRGLLKSPVREGELVRKTVIRYALAWPGVAFRLRTDDKETLVALGGTLLERLGAILGQEIAAEMIEAVWETDDLQVTGYISRPTVGRSNREGQYFVLNGRPIRSGLLAVMLERPYAGRLLPCRYPLAIVQVEMDPRHVDVNVHPRKAEVRLAQERAAYQALLWAVEAALSPFPQLEQYPILDWPFPDEPIASGETVRESRPEDTAGGGLRVMGQVRDSYIVAQGSKGLVVIDQHAAHEQVLFETLFHGGQRANLEQSVQVELLPRQAERLIGSLNLLADLGLEIEPFGKRDLLLHALPPGLIHVSPMDLVAALLDELERDWHLDEERLREQIVARVACTAAVKAGEPLAMETMQDLVDDLVAVWSPAICPHGRPAFVTLSVEELERRFLRR
jgi:DNA mismatch repair protein MutL